MEENKIEEIGKRVKGNSIDINFNKCSGKSQDVKIFKKKKVQEKCGNENE